MIQLFNLQDKELSKAIRSLSPILYEPIKIENQLLDGTIHTQTIGTPRKYIKFEVLSNHEQVDIINSLNANGGELKLIVDNKYYVGLSEVGDWQRFSMRHKKKTDTFYTSEIRININKEGVI